MKSVVVIMGYIASGKDTLGSYVSSKYGFNHIELSSVLKQIALREGIPPTRASLIALSNRISERTHDGYLAEWILENYRDSNLVITGARQVGQLDFLRKHSNTLFLYLNSSPAKRYQRTLTREVKEETTSIQDFLQAERSEHSGAGVQNLDRCISRADYELFNEGSRSALYQQFDQVALRHGIEPLTRTFFAGTTRCAFDCSYCFANTASYKPPSLLKLKEPYGRVHVIYPSCDSELSISPAQLELIRLQSRRCTTVVSVSTKGYQQNPNLRGLLELDSELRASKRGFVKFSTSFSTSRHIPELEPRTSSFRERIKVLHSIKQKGIRASVSIKPILPFIGLEEYKEIVDATQEVVDTYLIGGLYFDPRSQFSIRYLPTIPGENRDVHWLEAQPEWKYAASSLKQIELASYILSQGKMIFSSDAALIRELGRDLWNT